MNFEKSPQELENWFTQKLESIRSDKNGDITIVGLASGSFDVPHENHTNFLRDCKNRLEIIEKGLVKLLVSLDTDSRIDLRKSKPGDKRPVYALKDRASRISGLYVTSPNDTRTPVADIIIPEGAEYAGSIFENLQTLAKYGAENNLIDSRICFGEHPQDLTDAQESGLKPLVISDDLVYAFNKNGQRISSTNIINSSKALNQN
jgi:bifunctional ADP-heptose synthase (sugar kinase/adenylyltransferase)